MRYLALVLAFSFALSPLEAKNKSQRGSSHSGVIRLAKAKKFKNKSHRAKRRVKGQSRVN